MTASSALNDINNAILDLQASDYNTYGRPLKRLARALADDDLKPLNDELKSGVDFDQFLEANKRRGGMMGSQSLDWPAEPEKELGLTLIMIERAAADPDWFLNFAHYYYHAGSKHNAVIRKAVSSAIIPFGRDYKSYVEARLMVSSPDPAPLVPPVSVVSGDMAYLDPDTAKKLVPIADLAREHFTETDWQAIGYKSGVPHRITPRLLKSLSWRDSDYGGHVLSVLGDIVSDDPSNLQMIENYMDQHYGVGGPSISTAPSVGQSIRFTPSVFKVPDAPLDPKLVAVMMPFGLAFDGVYAAIKGACANTNYFYGQRADDIWNDTTIIQDVFSLIFRSQVVICDYTGRNPNVFYEAGIAHTLGKIVIPITQSDADAPSDLRHHRYLRYLGNAQGLGDLETKLTERLNGLVPQQSPWAQRL